MPRFGGAFLCEARRPVPNRARPHGGRAWGLPKGRYICDDGREILYDLDYRPWLQSVNGRITLADSTEWVTHKRQEPFFYVPYSPWPYCSYEEMKKMRAILLRWERSDTWYREWTD